MEGSQADVHSLPASSSSIKTFPYLQVLSARSIRAPADSTKARVKVSAIYSKAGTPSKLYTLEGDVHEVGHDREQRERGSCRVESWCEELMKRAYKHVKPRRRLRAVVNPHGGKGNAQQLFEQICQPIFAAAECSVTVVSTGPANSLTNAFNLGRDHDCSAFDVLVPVSGDGIVHELLNGIASRPDGLAALRSTPIAPVPAGSGNAISINLYGPSRANDCAWAALGAIKGESARPPEEEFWPDLFLHHRLSHSYGSLLRHAERQALLLFPVSDLWAHGRHR